MENVRGSLLKITTCEFGRAACAPPFLSTFTFTHKMVVFEDEEIVYVVGGMNGIGYFA